MHVADFHHVFKLLGKIISNSVFGAAQSCSCWNWTKRETLGNQGLVVWVYPIPGRLPGKNCKGPWTEWSKEKLLGQKTFKCFVPWSSLMFRGPDSVSFNPETLHITAVTVLLVGNQMGHSYLCKVHQTAQGHGHRALKVVRTSLEGLQIPYCALFQQAKDLTGYNQTRAWGKHCVDNKWKESQIQILT